MKRAVCVIFPLGFRGLFGQAIPAELRVNGGKNVVFTPLPLSTFSIEIQAIEMETGVIYVTAFNPPLYRVGQAA